MFLELLIGALLYDSDKDGGVIEGAIKDAEMYAFYQMMKEEEEKKRQTEKNGVE